MLSVFVLILILIFICKPIFDILELESRVLCNGLEQELAGLEYGVDIFEDVGAP